MFRHTHVSLFLLLLLLLFAQLYSTSGSLAAVTPQCMLGKMRNRSTDPSAGVVRELPRKGQSAMQAYTVATRGGRKRIRIVASTRDLQNKRRYCSEVGMSIWDFNGEPFLCDKFHVVSDDEIRKLMSYVIPGAVKLHADRLLVDRLDAPLVVPEFEKDSVCNYFTVPISHHCQGVENADMVLYVAAKPVTAFATPCAKDASGRPIVVAMNFREHNKFGLRYSVRFAAHELAHALGFDYKVFVENDMVKIQEGLRGKSRTVVVAEETKKRAQEHYGCADLEGVELAFANTDETEVASHWAHRVAKDELMSSYTVYGPGYYTALTMSVFDALPYYTANWGMEEPMTWGNNSGCKFIRENCITKGVSNFPEMFCSGVASRCTSDRFAIGTCDSLDSFKNKNEADNCPYAKPIRTQTSQGIMAAPCSVTLENDIPGSVTGNNSWCLDGDELVVAATKRTTEKAVGGVCARILCKDDGVVNVQYAGDKEWHVCREGELLEPSQTSSLFARGKIKCPKYDEVCTIAPNGTSLRPLILPPGDEFDSVPDNGGDDYFGSSSSAGGDSDDKQSGNDNADNENQGGSADVGNGNQGGDGCIVPALLAPVLVLVMVLALLLH